MNNNLTSISKLLSLVLRHKPETIGLTLDESGWANIADLITCCKNNNKVVTLELIQEVVSTNDKQRFSISEDGLYIRANQGHSINVELNLEPETPPAILFHGTATRFLDDILREGIHKRNRQHVHLSSTEETATSIGMRHGKPVILSIAAEAMHDAGHAFFLSKNGVWLTEQVPAEYVKPLIKS